MAERVTADGRSFAILKGITAAALVLLFGRGLLYNFLPLAISLLIAIGVAVLIVMFAQARSRRGEFDGLLGSASFGSRADVQRLEATGDLLIGRSAKSGKLLRYDGPAHLLTMAPTRSGKGVGTIIPNLLLLDHSV